MPDQHPSDPHLRDLAAATSDQPKQLTSAVTWAMAIAAGAAAANVWYNQPMLGAMAHEFGVTDQAVSAVPTATQAGFALGILLLIPLGDRMDRRRLIIWQLVATTLALAFAALAPNVSLLVVASVLVGAGGATAQQIIPFAAELAAPEQRGRVVGLVMSGLLSGVLLARVLSGAVAEHFGWRAMWWVGAVIAVGMAVVLRLILPRSQPTTRASYGALFASLIGIIRHYPTLRRATLIQACVFATISAFWSVLALLLDGPAFGLGPQAAGLFGIIGVAGIMAAPLAGRISDTRGPYAVIGLAVGLVAASFVLLGAWPTLAGLVIGVVLVDLGAQASMVSNQAVIFALAPEARGRINTVYMTGMFIGGAVGAAAAGEAWTLGGGGIPGFRAVCGLCVLGAVVAGVLHLTRPRSIPQ